MNRTMKLIFTVTMVLVLLAGEALAEKANKAFDNYFNDDKRETFDILKPIITLDDTYEEFENADIMGTWSTFVCAWGDLYDYEINQQGKSARQSLAMEMYQSVENGLFLAQLRGTNQETEHINMYVVFVAEAGKSIGKTVWMDYNISTHELRGFVMSNTRYKTLQELANDQFTSLFMMTTERYYPDAKISDMIVGGDELMDMMRKVYGMIQK